MQSTLGGGKTPPVPPTGKVCFKCQQFKPLTAFYKHPQMADGHLNKCKDCSKKDVINNRNNKLEYYQAYDRERDDLPHRVQARRDYRGTEAYRISHYKGSKKYHRNNPGKYRARVATANAIRKGILVRPDACQECHKGGVIHAHHCDYNKPLDVMWLCPTCHGRWHRHNTPVPPIDNDH